MRAFVFSTYVEVILLVNGVEINRESVLHVCGGDPSSKTAILGDIWVFSTYVEVILKLSPLVGFHIGVLHVCGGDPNVEKFGYPDSECSPRMWR